MRLLRPFHITVSFVVGLMLGLSTTVWPSSEFVTVAKILSNDDHGIIVRSNGNAYNIEKGVGCLSFWRYEGKQVLITSPGMFLGIGSELILPDDNQKCRIWDAKELGPWGDSSVEEPSRPSKSQLKASPDMCIDGHWISSVSNNGEIVVLEDSSVWEVNVVDAIKSMLWLPTQKVLICGNRMINNRNGKIVRVFRLK